MLLAHTMPRNKNPNPRQVTDESTDNPSNTNAVNTDVIDGTEAIDSADLPEPDAENSNHSGLGMMDANSDPSGSPLIPTIVPESPDSNQDSIAHHDDGALDDDESAINNDTTAHDTRKNLTLPRPKSNAWTSYNSTLMEWVCQRFTIRKNTHISASSVIKLYQKEVSSKHEYAVPLHNYQVGQFLRRIFPNLSRCKITRNRKREWVYKDLCPKDLTEEEIEALVPNFTIMAEASPENKNQPLTTSTEIFAVAPEGSPMQQSNIDDIDQTNTRNEILRGLLNEGNAILETAHSPLSTKSDKGDSNQVLTGRDIEVQNWLLENYKYKDGYFVKSYDLLNRYNKGRVEMVKYLSQVGRVMKFAFPDVKHQRKSFLGGKREWVYLNLKPIDVDSDSEEALGMQLEHIRKMARNNMYRQSDWKQNENKSLSMVHYHAHDANPDHMIKLPSRTYFPTYKVKSVAGKKMVIKRENFDECTKSDQDYTNNAEGHSYNDAAIFARLQAGKEDNLMFNAKRMSYERNVDPEQWASKRLKLCASDINGDPHQRPENTEVLNLSTPSDKSHYHQTDNIPSQVNINSAASKKASRLDSMINILHSGQTDNNALQRGTTFLNDNRDDPRPGHKVIDLTMGAARQEMRQSPNTSPIMFAENSSHKSVPNNSTNTKYFDINDETSHLHNMEYSHMNGDTSYYARSKQDADSQLNWEFLQMYNPHQFGWIKCSQTSHKRFNGASKKNMFIEYLMVNGQWLVNGHRIIREVKIYSDWNVSIYVLGRRIYPDVLNGITDLEKSKSSLDKVFRVLSNAQICMGFQARSITDLHIHGILVSKSEVWSSREESEEEVRQRAVNCQILFNGNSLCCSKCERINRLYNQQRIAYRK